MIGARLFAPGWRWMTIAALGAFATCLWLAAWQFDRLFQKAAASASAATQWHQPPLALDVPDTLERLLRQDSRELGALTYRTATVRGTFDHLHDEALTMQVVGGRLGVRLITPLRVAGSDAAVIVDRGWLPIDYDRPVMWMPFQIAGSVTVEGRLRPGFRRAGATGVTETPALARDLDLVRLAAALPYPILGLVLTESPAPEGVATETLPVRRELNPPQDAVPHLFYAVQWLAIALIVGGGYVSLVASDRNRTRVARLRATRASS